MKIKLKYFYTLFLLLLLLSQIFKYPISVLNFYFKQKQIAQNLCVKKQIKNNNCQGHCQLEEKIAQIEQVDKNDNTSMPNNIQFEISLFDATNIEINILHTLINIFNKVIYCYSPNGLLQGYSKSLLKPPLL